MDITMTLIFDIGFNKGEFTDACIDKIPGCEIIGVEANKDLFYDAPKRENLTLLNRLVAATDNEEIEFFVEFGQTGISTASKDFMENSRFAKGSKYLRPKSGNWTKAGKVSSITLDTLIEQYGSPDVIKIDVEGYEHQVILGLSKKTGKICFECHEEESEKLNKIIEHLHQIGYNEFGFIGYLEEKDAFVTLTYSEQGDPYLVEPDDYYSWNDLKKDLDECFIAERRVNYGMFWCR